MSQDTTRVPAYLESEIATCERRIAKIRENPDPTRAKSNVILYEIDRDLRREQIDAWREGRPMGWISGCRCLVRALGLVPWDGIMAADRSYGQPARRYFDTVRRMGIAEHACDRTTVLIPMVLEGDFPAPSFLGNVNHECTPIYMCFNLLAHLLNIPTFYFERHFIHDDASLKYVTEQLQELIAFVEKNIPGTKYDEGRMVELQEYERLWWGYQRDIWELRKQVPCPISNRESFRELRQPGYYPDPVKALDYARLYRDEIRDKARERTVAGKEEKLRLLWSVSGPFYADPMTWLEKQGVSIPAFHMTSLATRSAGMEPLYGDEWSGRKLSPLEEEARQVDIMWGRLAPRWVQSHVDMCRDLKIDGIVYFLQWGCPTTSNLGKVVAETAKRELEIPTLLIEGRMLEESVYDEKDFQTRLSDFADICLTRKDFRQRHGWEPKAEGRQA